MKGFFYIFLLWAISFTIATNNSSRKLICNLYCSDIVWSSCLEYVFSKNSSIGIYNMWQFILELCIYPLISETFACASPPFDIVPGIYSKFVYDLQKSKSFIKPQPGYKLPGNINQSLIAKYRHLTVCKHMQHVIKSKSKDTVPFEIKL